MVQWRPQSLPLPLAQRTKAAFMQKATDNWNATATQWKLEYFKYRWVLNCAQCAYGTYSFAWNTNNGRDLIYFTFRKHTSSQRWRKGLATWKIHHWIDQDSNPGPPAWKSDALTTTPPGLCKYTDRPRLLWHWPWRVERCRRLGEGEVFENKS